MHILPTISRSKSNQTMKFGQLIEYKMRNTFLEKLYTICGEKLCPQTLFLKNLNWAYLWIITLKFVTFFSDCMPNWGLSKYIETKLQKFRFYHKQSFFFLKKKKILELLSQPHFQHDIFKKYISLVTFY